MATGGAKGNDKQQSPSVREREALLNRTGRIGAKVSKLSLPMTTTCGLLVANQTGGILPWFCSLGGAQIHVSLFWGGHSITV